MIKDMWTNDEEQVVVHCLRKCGQMIKEVWTND